MKMTICDKCGAEITEVTAATKVTVFDSWFDLCPKCREELKPKALALFLRQPQ